MITTRQEILRELNDSRKHGNVLGVLSPSVRPGIFLCVVKDVCRDEDEDDFLIVLNQNVLVPGSTEGFAVHLKEITGLCII